MVDVVRFFFSIPPVTRVFTSICVLTTLALSLNIINPYQMYLHLPLIWKGEVWRLVTTFVFFGNFSIDWVFHMFFLYRYCSLLEEGSFIGRSAELCWMIIVQAAMLLALVPVLVLADPILFLGPSLTLAMVYVWGKRNPHAQMAFLGILQFKAPMLPWVLLGLGLLLGHNPVNDLLGILVGHVYYFLEDVYAHPVAAGGLGGPRVLKAPSFLVSLIDGRDEDEDIGVDAVHRRVQNEDLNAQQGDGPGGFNWQ